MTVAELRQSSWIVLLLAASPIAACGVTSTSGGPAGASDAAAATGQHPRTLSRRMVREVEGRYLLFLPASYDGSRPERWPMILFLHGAGERGDNLHLVMRHGPPKRVEQHPDFPFVVVSPQVATDRIWSNAFLDALLDEVVASYAIDPDRVYLTGLSMGGYGAWSLAMEFPHRFAAMAPVSGGGVPSGACALKHLPIWVFHGTKDDVVPLDRDTQLVTRLRECGGNVRFTVYPDAGHDAWTRTYDDPELYDWFLRHRRQPPAAAPR
ncbi:MAG: prolyl oligopeptidase family serine peptidase [Gemmatimonadaceae bacterium]